MSYCENKDTAAVIYNFKDSEEKIFVVGKDDLPVTIVEENVKMSSGILTDYFFPFNGDNPGSYSFTAEAPPEVPSDVEVEIYLTSGTWDDYGGIGSYSTGYGVVMSYDGEPILIGNGRSVEGTVTNLHPVECYAKVGIDWRYEIGCKIKISSRGKILYEDEGDCPLRFEVVCDEDCPKGYLKCASNKYPGYCCLPCKPTANKIRALGNKL